MKKPKPKAGKAAGKKKAAGKQSIRRPRPPSPRDATAPNSANASNPVTPTHNICDSPAEVLVPGELSRLRVARLETEKRRLEAEMRGLLLRMHQPLLSAVIMAMQAGLIMAEHPRAFAKGMAEMTDFRTFLPLLELADCKRAEETVRAAWKARGGGEKGKFRELDLGTEAWWQQLLCSMLAANPEAMEPVVKACVTVGGRSFRDRLKKARKRGVVAKRKLLDLLLLDWLGFGLWLFNDEAAVALLRAAHDIEVWPETYARYVRQLGLYRRLPSAIHIGDSDKKGKKRRLYLTRALRAELSELKGK